jgi:adenosylcobalamin-dependent ribonucleoside-triphosphate reductase
LLAAGSGSEEFLDLKNYEKNPDRVDIGWASNNSILINDGDQVDYESIANRIIDNGEPGIIYLNNIHKYGRIGELDSSDSDAIVVNPCGESAQISKEACNLSEVFPTRCDGIVDFLRTLKFAYLYNKSVTLLDHHDPETNKVIQRNRRIGCSVSGVVEFLSTKGSKDVLEQWLEAGYGYVHNLDKKYSEWLNIPESIRKTVIKPSGTVSILSGVTPGVHYPVADTHIRRVRISNHHPLVEIAGEAGYHIEPDKYSDNTMVISFPVKGKGIPDELTSSIFDKADIATFMAKHWADNAVSVTVKYKADERSMVEEVLRQNEDKWKSVSFLEIDTSAYEQLPYERITEEQYEEMVKDIKPMNFNGFHGDGEMEKFCSNDICEIKVG